MTAPPGWLPPPGAVPGRAPAAGWPAKPWLLPKPPPHDLPQPYLHVMHSRTWGWWRPLVGLLLLAVGYLVAAVVGTVLVVVALSTSGRGWFAGLADENLSDPRVLLATNVSLIVAIPVVWAVWGAAHQMRIGWSSSVLGRLRWRLFLPWTSLAVATVGAGIVLSLALSIAGGGEVSGPPPSFGWLVVVVLLTTPLQSAAEEYVFRGYLSQAIASWFRAELTGAVVAGVVSAALFSLAHAPPDFLTFLDRFAVGLAASAVVRLTGGLEAAISLHAVNNVVIFLFAGALGQSDSTDGSDSAALFDVVLTVLALAAYVALVAARRRDVRPELLTPALDLRSTPRFPVPYGAPPPWQPQPWQPQPWQPQPWAAPPWQPQPWQAQPWQAQPPWPPQQPPPGPAERSPWAPDPDEPNPWQRPPRHG